MARLPEPSPAAVNRRRLFELLEEPQEPFFLEVYLLEKGCSDRLLPTRSACIICWPREACQRLQRLTSRHCRTWRQVLVRIVLNWVDRSPYNGTAVLNRSSEFQGKGRRIERDLNPEYRRSCMAIDSKQSSAPVSVHQVRDTEDNRSKLGFQVPAKVVDMFNELLELAYTPAFYQLLGSSDTLLPECEKKAEEKTSSSDHEIEIAEKLIHEKRQRDHRAYAQQLTVSELTSSMVEWSRFQHQIKEIGTEIEAKLFEDIKEESVLIMLSSNCRFKRSSSAAAAASL